MAEKTKDQSAAAMTIENLPSSPERVGGVLKMSQSVVATIAGLAARQVKGLYSLGKSRLVSFGDDVKRGVEAEVGEKEAALDVDVVIEYGCNVSEMAAELRTEIARQVDQMAGRKVVEVNINVIDIHLEEEKTEPVKESSRVQ